MRTTMPPVRAALPPSLWTRVQGFVALTKPQIIELLLVTTLPTMFVAQGGVPPLLLMLATFVGGALAAGGANAINMFIDRDIDAVMHRTSRRPLVTGSVTPTAALVFAISLEVAAFGLLWQAVNLLSALLAVGACLFYVFVYSLWLKRSTSQNIVIGGAAGAVPVLIGWSSVTGTLGWAPLILFGVICLWTPPHTWALAIKYRDDYTAAEVPMLPVVASPERTGRQIVAYSIAMVAFSLVFWPVAHMGWIYGGAAVIVGALFLYRAFVVLNRQTPKDAMRLFGWSITYITVLFLAMMIDRLLIG